MGPKVRSYRGRVQRGATNGELLKGNVLHCIAEEIKSRLRSGNACYHSVQILLSSRLLSKNLMIKIYRLLFCMGVKLGR